MANNVAGQLLVYALLLFFMVVVVFLSYAMILHTEQTQMWSTIKDRGAMRTMPNGTTNYWYYIVRVQVPNVLNLLYFQVKTFYRLNDYQPFPISIVTEVCSYLRDPSDDVFSRHLMSVFFETIPHLLYYCPHGVNMIKP
uniref:Uncharacterized protein n=1 Tax=Anopheles melas TaxID=34690 RepID=A0A182UEN7_9DIPT